MTKGKLVFHKNFTRDTALILQQLWPICMEDGLMEIVPQNPHRPSVVDYIHNGTCEIWENDRAVDYIRREFIRFSQEKPRAALAMLARFEREKKALRKIWQRGILKNLSELKRFVAAVLGNMIGDLFVLYMAGEKGIPVSIRRKSYALRDSDEYFSASNRVFVNTLRKLFPRAKDYVNVIRYEELDRIPSLAELKKRYKNYVCVANKYGRVETLAAYAKRTGYRFIEDEAKPVSGLLRGRVANPGQAKGKAKLVFTTKDLAKVGKGDILISPMTTANFMPAIRKAAAIVTDEGGLLSHAAIVSRELRKPCLIATKSATKIFKDGDSIEVDAGAGWVRKVKANR